VGTIPTASWYPLARSGRRATKLAHDETDVISTLPRLDELSESLPEGMLADVLRDLLQGDYVDEPEARFQSSISP